MLFDVLKAVFSVPGVGCREKIVKATHQVMIAVGNVMVKNSKSLCRKRILLNSIMEIQSGLGTPTNMHGTAYHGFAPLHDLAQGIPVIYLFKLQVLHRCACDDESVVTLMLYLVKGFVKYLHVFPGCIFGDMLFHMEEVQLYLEGGVGEGTEQVRFCNFLHRHQVKQCDPQGADILFERLALLHDEYVLLFQLVYGRQIGGYINRHNRLFPFITAKEGDLFEILLFFMYENLTNLSLVKGAFAFLRKSWIYVIGAAALLWFMIRVIPKPGRAAYPCQRAAFPLASAFVLWMSGTLFSFKFVKDARSLLKTRRLAGAFALLVSGLLLFSLSNLAFPARELVAGVREARADVPELIPSYSEGSDSRILPAATVGLLKSQRENVLEIGYAEIEEMVREAVKLAGGFEEMISDGNTVVLKPNIVVNNFMGNPISPEANGMVTDWRVLAAVAKMVREQNPGGRILVIEGSASPSTQEGYELLKYTREFMPEVDEFIGIEDHSGAWKDTNSEYLRSVLLPPGRALYPDFKLPNGSAPYYYNKQYFEADVFISLPVLKNHESAGVTGAIKNMGIGGTPTNIYGNGEDVNGRWEVINHSASELHKFIHDFYYGRPADFAVMDGIQGYSNGPNWNNGPSRYPGTPGRDGPDPGFERPACP